MSPNPYGFTDPDSHQVRTSQTKPEPKLCDFCSVSEIFHVYPVRDYHAVFSRAISTEGWAACKACAQMIDAEQWHGLVDRALDRFLRDHPELLDDRLPLRDFIQQMHQGFRDNRLPTH